MPIASIVAWAGGDPGLAQLSCSPSEQCRKCHIISTPPFLTEMALRSWVVCWTAGRAVMGSAACRATAGKQEKREEQKRNVCIFFRLLTPALKHQKVVPQNTWNFKRHFFFYYVKLLSLCILCSNLSPASSTECWHLLIKLDYLWSRWSREDGVLKTSWKKTVHFLGQNHGIQYHFIVCNQTTELLQCSRQCHSPCARQCQTRLP